MKEECKQLKKKEKKKLCTSLLFNFFLLKKFFCLRSPFLFCSSNYHSSPFVFAFYVLKNNCTNPRGYINRVEDERIFDWRKKKIDKLKANLTQFSFIFFTFL